VVVLIDSLSDWLTTQSRLERISSLSAITLKSLSPQQANIEIAYKGDEQRLALALSQAGMEIERASASDGSPINLLTTSKSSRYKPIQF